MIAIIILLTMLFVFVFQKLSKHTRWVKVYINRGRNPDIDQKIINVGLPFDTLVEGYLSDEYGCKKLINPKYITFVDDSNAYLTNTGWGLSGDYWVGIKYYVFE